MSQEVLQRKTIQGQEPCRHCGAVDGFTRREQGPHIGEYCLACEKWQRWIPRRGLKLVEPPAAKEVNHPWGNPPREESKPRYSAAQIAHPKNIEERVASLEHDLRVVVQIFMGVGA